MYKIVSVFCSCLAHFLLMAGLGDERRPVDFVYLDFSKAFGTVSRDIPTEEVGEEEEVEFT